MHQLFDNYLVSINPDVCFLLENLQESKANSYKDNYKIVSFTIDGDGVAGNYLDQQFLDDPRRPVDQLLRWHFRQAVFANMRGAGEPIFECDFPPGSDVMGEITSSPRASELMEFQLFGRLAEGDRQEEIGS